VLKLSIADVVAIISKTQKALNLKAGAAESKSKKKHIGNQINLILRIQGSKTQKEQR